MNLPLVAIATTLRAGRRLFTAEVRITKPTTDRLMSHATTTYALSQALTSEIESREPDRRIDTA